MHILINPHRLQISLLIALVAGALTITACSDGEPAEDLTDTGVSNEQSSDAGGLPHVGNMDVVPWYASPDDVSPDDNGEEESWECRDIDDPEECRQTDGCWTYGTRKIDPEIVEETEGSCMGEYDHRKLPQIEHCVTASMTNNSDEYGRVYARYDAETDEYEVHIFSHVPSSQSRNENGFIGCILIPADEYPEDREMCYECRGSTDPEAD